MKTSTKSLQDMRGLQDLRTYTGTVRKSAKPDLPTTAIVSLSMRRNERDRILKELKMLRKRRIQLKNRLTEVEKEMTKLLEKATRTAVELRGGRNKGGKTATNTGQKNRTVLGY